MTKQDQLFELGAKCKEEFSSTSQHVDLHQYQAVAAYHDGAYDSRYVSPFTKSASNVDAEIFVVLQDWSSHDWLSGDFDPEVARLGYSPALATNINLGALLTKHFDIALKEVFATNLFPFIKRGNLNAGIPANLMQYAATKFCLPQIEIVKPKLVICMGIATFNAIRRVKSLKSVDNLQDGFEQPIVEADKEYWCQSHPGALGRINRESKGRTGQVNRDWAQMAERFRQV